MHRNLLSDVRFHAVGQGLFSSGALRRQHRVATRFNWVYDCGTLSDPLYLSQSIDGFVQDLRGENHERPTVHLLALSHFDHDHISGVVTLLGKVRVGLLLLPYMPLWKRLLVAFAEEITSEDPLAQFFVNPAAYLVAQEGARIDQIVFVPESQGEGPTRGEEGGASPNPEEDGDFEMLAPTEEPSDDLEKNDLDSMRSAVGLRTTVSRLQRSARLTIGKFWEFVPYNDASLIPDDWEPFRSAVERRVGELIAPERAESRKETLRQLRDLYDKQFGKSPKKRNNISLFLYAGPVQWLARMSSHTVCRMRPGINGWVSWRRARDTLGVLYTGDGYLNKSARITALESYFGRDRLDKILCMQVMHHGSHNNWQEGLAGIFNPRISVFSADPNHHHGHPDGEVIRDFFRFAPVLVDCERDLAIRTYTY